MKATDAEPPMMPDRQASETTGTAGSAKRSSVAWLYLTSAGLSLLGNGVATVVWPWLVLERTGNPAAAGLVATAIAIPSLLFAILGGQLIDTVGRKPMSIISDIVSGLSVIAVIAVDAWLGLNLTWFIVIGILGAVGDIPGMAARAALGGDVSYTSGKSMDFISGVVQSLGGLAFLVGPAAAGMLMATLPIQEVLWITAICSLLAAAFTALLRLQVNPDQEIEENIKGWRSWGRAWMVVLKSPVVQLLAFVALVSSTLIAPYLMLILPTHFQNSHNPSMLGFALSAYAVGMIAGGGVIAAVGSNKRRLIWVTSMVFFTIGFACIAMMAHSWILLAGMFVAGIGGGISTPLQMVLITEQIPENLRGRAFSVFNAIGQFAAPIGLSVATVSLTRVSIYTVAIAVAVIWAVAAVYSSLRGIMILPDAAQYDKENESDASASAAHS